MPMAWKCSQRNLMSAECASFSKYCATPVAILVQSSYDKPSLRFSKSVFLEVSKSWRVVTMPLFTQYPESSLAALTRFRAESGCMLETTRCEIGLVRCRSSFLPMVCSIAEETLLDVSLQSCFTNLCVNRKGLRVGTEYLQRHACSWQHGRTCAIFWYKTQKLDTAKKCHMSVFKLLYQPLQRIQFFSRPERGSTSWINETAHICEVGEQSFYRRICKLPTDRVDDRANNG